MKTFAYYNYQFAKIYNRRHDFYEDGIVLQDPEASFERRQQILWKILQEDCSGAKPLTMIANKNKTKKHRHKWLCQPIDGIAVMKISNRRRHKSEDINFNEVETDEYQSAIVIIDNRDGVQSLLIEMKTAAFASPRTVANIVELTLGDALAHYNLSISIDQLHLADAFWNIVDDRENFPNGFRKITFKFPHLNLDRLRSALDPIITGLRQDLDSDLTLIQSASPGSSLAISREKESLKELVDAATEVVGGNVIKLYPLTGKAINVGEDNYKTSQIDGDTFDMLRANEPEDVQRAFDKVKAFTKLYI